MANLVRERSHKWMASRRITRLPRELPMLLLSGSRFCLILVTNIDTTEAWQTSLYFLAQDIFSSILKRKGPRAEIWERSHYGCNRLRCTCRLGDLLGLQMRGHPFHCCSLRREFFCSLHLGQGRLRFVRLSYLHIAAETLAWA